MEMEEGDKYLAADRILGRVRLSKSETKTATLLVNALLTNNSLIGLDCAQYSVVKCFLLWIIPVLTFDWLIGQFKWARCHREG